MNERLRSRDEGVGRDARCILAVSVLGFLFLGGPGWNSIRPARGDLSFPGNPGGTGSGLDTIIHFPEEVLPANEIVERIGVACSLNTRVHGELVGNVKIRNTPVSARTLLNEALPSLGYAYLLRDGRIEVMTLSFLLGYHERHAITRSFEAVLSGPVLQYLLTTPDLVSTVGRIHLYPSQGLVVVHDLPEFVSRIEGLLEIAPLLEDSRPI